LIAVDALILSCGEPTEVPLVREMWRKSPFERGKEGIEGDGGMLTERENGRKRPKKFNGRYKRV
jgi:hypothetical protein